MGLKDMTLTQNPTIVVSGGQPVVFAEDGMTVANGLHLIVPADADYQTRRMATVKYRPPTLDPKTGVYGKDKKSISFVQPLVLPSGVVVFNTVRMEREVHPLLPTADATNLLYIGSQMMFASVASAFWATGSRS